MISPGPSSSSHTDDQLRSERPEIDIERFLRTYFDPYSNQLRTQVRETPLPWCALAVGVGFVLGALWKR